MSDTLSIQGTVPIGGLEPLQATPEFEIVAAPSEVESSARPVAEAAQVEELPAPFLAAPSEVEASAVPVAEVAQIEELPAPFLAVGSEVESSAAPVEEAAQIEELPARFFAPSNEVEASTPAAQELPTERLPRCSLGCYPETELPQPGFVRFYGLGEQPFGVTPDPAYLYLSWSHSEALKSLSCGIQNDRGFMTLIAKPGMGKTTLLNKLMEDLRGSARTVFLFQTQCDARGFLRYLLSELDVDAVGMDLVAMHNKLNEILFREMLAGRRFVLIVDEAQNLRESVLERIRLLSDFETTHAKLLEIVLAGQPQLAAKLKHPSLSQLRQRISVLANLEPLSPMETVRYIEHRLHVAGHSNGLVFAPEALRLIAELSHGVPRNINNMCFNALMRGYSQGRKTIDSEIVGKVAEEFDLESLVPLPHQPRVVIKPAPKAAADDSPHFAFRPLAPTEELSPPAFGPRAGTEQSPLPVFRPLATTASEGQSGCNCLKEAKSSAGVTISGKLNELAPSRHWGKGREFRADVSLEREPSSDISVADRYYCCSFYVDEEEATVLRAGQPIRIRIEQD